LLLNRLLLFQALEMKFRELKLRRDPECPVCGAKPTITKLIDYEDFCGVKPQTSMSLLHPDEVTVQEMRRALGQAELGIQVIDVREPNEYEIAHVEGVILLPLSQLARRFNELEPNQQYYIHCHVGVRSMRALEFLRQQGFKHLKSVRGGIEAWSREIDPAVPRY
jgi:rhodanese-related sulfurtransferase